MSTQLAAWLVDEGVLPKATVHEAVCRQLIYGGALDTAILEMGAMTESAIWTMLAAATGFPVPSLSLCEATEAPPALLADRTRSLRTVPVATEARISRLLCAEPIAADEIRVAAAEHGLEARLYVVSEVRLLAARQRVYGEPLPARYAPLWAGIVGTERARKSHSYRRGGRSSPSDFAPVEPAPFDAARPTPLEHVLNLSGPLPLDSSLACEIEIDAEPQMGTPMGPAGPPGDTATEALCRRARDAEDKGRILALRALRGRLSHPPVQRLLEDLRAAAGEGQGTDAIHAIGGLAEIRDGTAIDTLIERMTPATPPDILDAAHRALVALTVQDFGKSRRRWQAWARSNAQRPRIEWLLDGLLHKQSALRIAASEDLRQLSGESFGYVFDRPKRERDEARQRWIAWWKDREREAGRGQPVSVDTATER